MQITEITVFPTNDGLVRAYVDIVFDNCFKFEGIKVIKVYQAIGFELIKRSNDRKECCIKFGHQK
jgi:DNA-binding cell septation regulator SpoVG